MSISDSIYLVYERENNKRGFVEVSKAELAILHSAALVKESELRKMDRQLEKIAANQGVELSRVETQFEKWKDALGQQTDGLNHQIGRFAQIVMPQGNQLGAEEWYSAEMARLRSAHQISPEYLETQPEGIIHLEEPEIVRPEKKQIAQVPLKAPVVQVLETAPSSAPAKIDQKKKRAEGSNLKAKAPAADETQMIRSIISVCVLFATFIALSLIKLNQQYHIIPPIRRM